MKRSIFLTLLALAAGLSGAQAQSTGGIAPIINDLPSPIIGSEVKAGALPFVFPDALDLDAYNPYPDKPASQIQWSYTVTGTPKYTINGVGPLHLPAEDPAAPGLRQINNQVLNSELNPDGKTNTVTIRNIHLQPFIGTGAAPSGTGIIDSQAVTLFASDGTTYSSKSVLFYTENGGQSRLSTPGPHLTNVAAHDFSTGTHSWTFSNIVGAISSSGASGLCLGTGSNMMATAAGSWNSAFGLLPLTDNAVYRIRANLNFTQAASHAKVPFWDLIINNFNGAHGLNLFGCDCYYLDNEGGANAIRATSTPVEIWWCPLPIQTASWKANAFTAAADPDNDAFLQFRILDVSDRIGAGWTAGTICMSGLTIDKTDLADLTPVSALTQVYHVNSFTKNTTASVKFVPYPAQTASSADFNGGAITLTPGLDGQKTEYGLVTPGDPKMNYLAQETIPDNFPIVWEPQTLYMVTMDLSAPDANSEANPWDVIWLGMDSPTNEVIGESWVTANLDRAGMPKQGTPQTYTYFYWSGYGTNSTMKNANSLRWRLAVANLLPLPPNPNTGSLRLHGVTVNKVKLPANL